MLKDFLHQMSTSSASPGQTNMESHVQRALDFVSGIHLAWVRVLHENQCFETGLKSKSVRIDVRKKAGCQNDGPMLREMRSPQQIFHVYTRSVRFVIMSSTFQSDKPSA